MEKHKVAILLAVYKPNITFFRQQLQSINKQDYHNIKVYICDDSEDIHLHKDIKDIISKELIDKEYEILRNDKNLGSNKTFEKLTNIAIEDIFAYCDQDDIWHNDKIKILVSKLVNGSYSACYSDLSVINEYNKLIYKSFTDMSKRLKHLQGDGLSKTFVRRNSITGCTMVVKKEIAKKSLPFPDFKTYVHDHWLALNASIYGSIGYIEKPLVKYRIHGNNQIGGGMLANIDNIDDYLNIKIKSELKKVKLLKERFIGLDKDLDKTIRLYSNFVLRRQRILEFREFKGFVVGLRYLINDPQLIIFEYCLAYSPSFAQRKILTYVKR